MTYSGQISSDRLLRLVSGLNCKAESDPSNRRMVWVVSPHSETLAVFPKNDSIPREQVIEIMKHLDVFNDFLTKLGFKINRQQPPLE